MDPEASVFNPLDLERMLIDESAKPRYLRISLLESITNNFSDDRQVGNGGFAVVYEGLLQNGKVAVKKLTQTLGLHETKFLQEVECLMSVKHKNVVRFLGYCSDIQQKMQNLNGQSVLAEEQQRFLCFEFLPWTLDKYIKDPSGEHEWRTCYKIIKGICEGLYYLHQQNIVHLDLKPANILLDHDMVPKIADFGLSKRFDEKQTHLLTSNLYGTLGYMAPEFYDGQITFKSDIYSLGIIIIEILTGNKGCPGIDNVLESWSVKLNMSPGDIQLEPIRVCTEIGIECTDFIAAKRPDTRRILERLNEMESTYGVINESSSVSAAPSPLQRITGVLQEPRGTSTKILSNRSSEISRLLDIHPLELRFPWEPNRAIKCPLTMTNRTDRYVGVWITPTCEDTSSHIRFNASSIWETVLKPHSTIAVAPEMKAQQEQPPGTMFEVLIVVTRSKEEKCLAYSVINAGHKPNVDREFLQRVEKLGGEVHLAMLKAVTCDPASCQTVIHNQHLIPAPSFSKFGYIHGIDPHPTETWILVHELFHPSVSIFNYETQKIEMALEIKRVSKKKGSILSPSTWKEHILSSLSFRRVNITSAKFIAQEQWFAAGDNYGWVHVYNYTTKDKVMEFEPYQYHGEPDKELQVLLAVHPTSPYLLTSLRGDHSFKLWDWSNRWECIQKFDSNCREMSYAAWNPMDSDTFISISSKVILVWNIHCSNPILEVWNIHSSDPITISWESYETSSFLYRDGHQNFMVLADRMCARVWDMKTNKTVHELSLKEADFFFHDIACHPTRPILVTRSRHGSVCVWDASTYRLMKMIDFDWWSETGSMVLIGTDDSTRLVVGCEEGILVMEINMPTLDS